MYRRKLKGNTVSSGSTWEEPVYENITTRGPLELSTLNVSDVSLSAVSPASVGVPSSLLTRYFWQLYTFV